MCGIRVGCLISKNKNVIQSALKFAQARLSPPTFGQVAAEAALNTPKDYFNDVIRQYVSRRDILVKGLNQIPGVFCPKPKGAFYVIAKLPVDSADNFAQWLLEDFQFQGATVMVAPASGFYSTPNSGLDQVRIAYVLNESSLSKSIEILKNALAVYPGKKL